MHTGLYWYSDLKIFIKNVGNQPRYCAFINHFISASASKQIIWLKSINSFLYSSLLGYCYQRNFSDDALLRTLHTRSGQRILFQNSLLLPSSACRCIGTPKDPHCRPDNCPSRLPLIQRTTWNHADNYRHFYTLNGTLGEP